MAEYITTEKEITNAWAKASPGEKSQITAFIVSLTEPPPKGNCRTKPGGKLFLMRIRHHDTGKPILTAGVGLADTKGLPPDKFRPLIGLSAKPVRPVATKPAPVRKVDTRGKSLLNKGAKK